MEINLSDETIKTAYNALNDAYMSLARRHCRNVDNAIKFRRLGYESKLKKSVRDDEIVMSQLQDVKDAKAVFEEMLECIS